MTYKIIDVFYKSDLVIENALRKSITFSSVKKIDQICSPLSKLGVSGFFYMKVFSDGTFIDFLNSNVLPWSWHYFTKLYQGAYKASCLKKHLLNQPTYVYWDAFPNNTIWQESMDFGFCQGISINHHSKDYTEVFSFFSSKSSNTGYAVYLENPAILRQFTAHFLICADDLIQQANRERWLTPKIYHLDIDETFTEKNFSTGKDFLKQLKPNGMFFFKKNGISQLTLRETTILALFSQGYSAKEIAIKLNISYRTVETHLENIRIKTGLKKLSELITLSVEQGIIDISPYILNDTP